MGQKYTFFYFCHFLIFVPGAAFLENKAWESFFKKN
jgi:hypothetical protein